MKIKSIRELEVGQTVYGLLLTRSVKILARQRRFVIGNVTKKGGRKHLIVTDVKHNGGYRLLSFGEGTEMVFYKDYLEYIKNTTGENFDSVVLIGQSNWPMR